MSTARRGGPQDREPTPVNYRAVTPARARAQSHVVTHERLHPDRATGWLGLELTTLDAVHIGAGAPLFDGKELVRATVVTFDDEREAWPIIPGASLKGAVRNLAELLLGGGGPDDADVADSAIGGLFGYVSRRGGELASRIGFDDARADEPSFGTARLPHPFQPRKQGGRRIYGPPLGALRGEVPYDVIPQGERFHTRMHFVNVVLGELGAILTCLGLDGTFHLRVGGGKFAGLGRVRVAVTGGSLRNGYAQPRPERLDAEAATAFATRALEQRTFAPGFEQPLEQIRRALGGGR